MHTINVSLPSQLKLQADNLVKAGYFASFSDLVRTALRRTLSETQLESLATHAMREHHAGKALVLKDKADISDYVNQVFDKGESQWI